MIFHNSSLVSKSRIAESQYLFYFCTLWDKNPTLPSALKTGTALTSAFFYCQYLQRARGQKKQTLHFLYSEWTFLFLKYLSVCYWGKPEKPFLSLISAGVAVLPLYLTGQFLCLCLLFKPHSIKINVKLPLNAWLCEQPSTKAP